MKPVPVALAAALIAMSGVATGALADAVRPRHGAPEFGYARPSQGALLAGMSLGEAIQMVEQRFNARVVRSTVSESNGRRIYVMRVLSDREVRVVRVDAASGAIL